MVMAEPATTSTAAAKESHTCADCHDGLNKVSGQKESLPFPGCLHSDNAAKFSFTETSTMIFF